MQWVVGPAERKCLSWIYFQGSGLCARVAGKTRRPSHRVVAFGARIKRADGHDVYVSKHALCQPHAVYEQMYRLAEVSLRDARQWKTAIVVTCRARMV